MWTWMVRMVIQVHPSSSKVDLDIKTFKLVLQPGCSECGTGRESCRAARLRARLCCEGERGLGSEPELPRVRRGDHTTRYTAAHMIT